MKEGNKSSFLAHYLKNPACVTRERVVSETFHEAQVELSRLAIQLVPHRRVLHGNNIHTEKAISKRFLFERRSRREM
jgi:hypothetical protein